MWSLAAISAFEQPLADQVGHLALAGAQRRELDPGGLAPAAVVGDQRISRRVIVGESVPSPAWTCSIARTISGGGVSFRRKPAAPARKRPQDELVGVERGQHDHLGRRRLGRGAGAWPRSRPAAACGCPSARRRAGAGRRPRARSRPSSASPTTSIRGAPASIIRSPERTSASSSTSRTRISVHGSAARRTKSPRRFGPCSSAPPASSTRSASPISPLPPGCGSGASADRAADDLDHEVLVRAVRRSPPRPRRARACARSSAPPARRGRPCGRPCTSPPSASIRERTFIPAARDSSTSDGIASSVGCGGAVTPSPRRAARRSPRAGPAAPRGGGADHARGLLDLLR